MKTTDTENPVPDRAQPHPEQLSNDTNPRRLYEVTVHRTDYFYTRVRVWANSEADAENNAEKRAALQDKSKWEVADRDLYSYSVEVVKRGGAHA